MATYAVHKKSHLRYLPRRVWLLFVAIIIVVIVGAVVADRVYTIKLQAYNSASQTSQIFTVSNGSSVKQIADSLESQHLIRSSWALQLYVHSKQSASQLQAGTYALSPSETTPEIVTTMIKGSVTSRLVTILPGRRIDQVRADLINAGFSPAAVTAALQIAQYSSLPVFAFLPANVSNLEGLLWPDSFEKTATTAPSVIIQESLEEMGQHLTAAVQAEFAAEGLTTYQGITLTSIVEQEVSKPSDQAQVAQVFLSRLKAGMPLGSDVTANYGAIAAGQSPSLSYDSPYNTLLHTGLPPGPISTISLSALQAVTHPANTNWLYFVAGDNGTTYFSTNLADQQANTQKYCHKLCAEQ
jgi:UPF0755 protein